MFKIKLLLGMLLWFVAGTVLASDYITVLDGNRDPRNLKAIDNGGIHSYVMIPALADGTTVNLDDSARIGFVPHEHEGHADLHFHSTGITGDDTYILVDMSDSTNYPHGSGAVVLHVDAIDYEIDSDNSGSYDINFYYLENCDATDCDSRMWYSISGNKTSGNSQTKYINWAGDGPVLKSTSGGTMSSSNMVTLNDTTYNTSTNYKSTYSYSSAVTPAGNGDIIMVVDHTAGVFDLHINLSYHIHDATHD